MQYAIYEGMYSTIIKKLESVAKKCKKYGNKFDYKVVGEEIRTEKKNGMSIGYKFKIIEVEGVAKIDDWEFIAAMDVYESGNIIRRCNNDIELPEQFKTSDNVCDHCHTKRQRNTLYIIRNTETGEFKQVGANCLASYTHGLDMEYIAAWIDGITKLESKNGKVENGTLSYYNVRDIIKYAYIIINKMGYLKNNSYSYSVSTKDLVGTMLFTDGSIHERVKALNERLEVDGHVVRFTAEDFLNNVSKNVDKIIEYYKSANDGSEFVHNVQVALNNEYVLYKNIGTLCYLPAGYNKHIDYMNKNKNNNKHYGEIGKRYRGVRVESIRCVSYIETCYGYRNIYKIVIEGGYVLKWFTSGEIYNNPESIDFTVKEHGEFKGVMETEVTRCKIHYSESAAA